MTVLCLLRTTGSLGNVKNFTNIAEKLIADSLKKVLFIHILSDEETEICMSEIHCTVKGQGLVYTNGVLF